MMRWFRVALFTIAAASTVTLLASPGSITLVGRGEVAGNLLDKSGLSGNDCSTVTPANCTPKAIFGGFGSDITYTGSDDVFIAAPDRGPFDGLTNVPYLDRVHYLHITTDIDTKTVTTTLLDTRLLRNEAGQNFVGATSAFDINNPAATLRLDPEGVRPSSYGTFFVSDEYGPYLFEFDRMGNLLRRLGVPSKFLIANPSADGNAELTGNDSGRQSNRGMEGLAITPDGSMLVGIMQNALIQDGGLNSKRPVPDRVGLNSRILTVDVASGETHEYVYVVDTIGQGEGVNELLAINSHQFLLVERDNRSYLTTGQAPMRKNIYMIDLNGATDVSGIANLPASGLPSGVTAVSKSLFINLLATEYGIEGFNTDPAIGPHIGEKIEGLAWGPDLADGRHLLYVTTDNDLNQAVPTQIFAFAIPSSLIDYVPQVLPGPMFAPGQLKKLLGN